VGFVESDKPARAWLGASTLSRPHGGESILDGNPTVILRMEKKSTPMQVAKGSARVAETEKHRCLAAVLVLGWILDDVTARPSSTHLRYC